MTREEINRRTNELTSQHRAALQALIEPARSAANAMKDAKMDRTADPLMEALFKVDAITTEMRDFLHGNMESIMDAWIEAIRGGRP